MAIKKIQQSHAILPLSTPACMSRTQLSIDTSGLGGSLGVMRDLARLKMFSLPEGQRSAATISSRLQDAIRWCEAERHTIDFVAVANGPGSFTGLRIGVTTAKVYCYATGLPLVAIDTVAGIAASAFMQNPNVESVLVGMNAYRGQIFAGRFERQWLLPAMPQESDAAPPEMNSTVLANWLAQMNSARVLDSNQWKEMLLTSSDDTVFSGESSVFPSDMQSRVQQRVVDDAFGVGILGHYAATLQQWVDPMQLSPRYLKSSAAEELAASRRP